MMNRRQAWLVGASLMGALLAAGPAYAEKSCPSLVEYPGCPVESFGNPVCTTKRTLKCATKALNACKAAANARIRALDATLAAVGSSRAGIDRGEPLRLLGARVAKAQRDDARLSDEIARGEADLDRQRAERARLRGRLLEAKTRHTESAGELDALAKAAVPIGASEHWVDCQRGYAGKMLDATRQMKAASPPPAQAALLVEQNQRLLFLTCYSLFDSPPAAVPAGAAVGPSEACAFDLERTRPVGAIDAPIFAARERARAASARSCAALATRWAARRAALKAGTPLVVAELDADLKALADLVMPPVGAKRPRTPPAAVANHGAVDAVHAARTAYNESRSRLVRQIEAINRRIVTLENQITRVSEVIIRLRETIAGSKQELALVRRTLREYERYRPILANAKDTLDGPRQCGEAHCTCENDKKTCRGECERLREPRDRGPHGGLR